MNGRNFGRLRLLTVGIAVVGAGILWPLRGVAFAAGFLGSAVWAVLSFMVVERLVREALRPSDRPRNVPAIIGLVVMKIGLYGLGFWILLSGLVPPISCFFGFTLLLLVLTVASVALRPKLATQPDMPRDAAGRERDD